MGDGPQLEKGYTRLANEIVEEFARQRIPSGPMRVLWTILRKTYGWKKKTDRISLGQFCDATGLRKSHVQRALSYLVARKIVLKGGALLAPKYMFNKHFGEWKKDPSDG